MNKSIFNIICVILVSAGLFFVCFGFAKAVHASKPFRIGILMPIDHAALQEIVAGFEKVVRAAFPHAVQFNVQNAQGDIKLQRSIIELFAGQKMDLIVPIGTSATQMTLSLVKEEPVVSLAAVYPEAERQKRHPRNVTGVLDEISGKKKLEFIQAILPQAKTITLIFHGANEKNYQEVAELKNAALDRGLNLQTIMIQHLPDLEAAGHGIAADSKALLILKDNMLASGIRLLVNIADKHGIPVITSDEGTVKEGAAAALGVRERMIGEAGGKLAVKILKGYPIADLPMQEMQTLTVFYNPIACEQKIALTALEEYASKNHYPLVRMDNQKK